MALSVTTVDTTLTVEGGNQLEVTPNNYTLTKEDGTQLSVVRNGLVLTANANPAQLDVSPNLVTLTVGTGTIIGGGGEENLTRRNDLTADPLYYKGFAVPGSLESAAVWRIIRGTETSPGVWTELFANGNDAKTNVWDDRASLSYS